MRVDFVARKDTHDGTAYREKAAERYREKAAQNPFYLPRVEFVNYFRLTPELVMDVINAIRANLWSERLTGLAPEIKVLIAIQFYAQGSYQRNVGNQFQFNVRRQQAVASML
ncbi:uncharacterized protein [Mycetomoellerius zeteki]|uniref:uncharacterized protein n=1 Tax=Mycetomoellerius zeteki TaxID=64791 RepID=UPI00084E897F|nr:PREDICTED: uncharacterized protein LOC108730196 [Trachymyrmex zeteki]